MRKISEDLASLDYLKNTLPSSKARKAVLAGAQEAKQRLYASIESGQRGDEARALQIEALLDYQEHLYAADLLVDEPK